MQLIISDKTNLGYIEGWLRSGNPIEEVLVMGRKVNRTLAEGMKMTEGFPRRFLNEAAERRFGTSCHRPKQVVGQACFLAARSA
jgi:hypothetical protein